jgi:SAM-dependent methyltransferase
MHTLITKLRNDPLGFFWRAIYKTVIAPVKYRGKGGYDAARYWGDRFAKYGTALKGVGDEGLSEQDNRATYERAGAAFLDLCRQEGIEFSSARVLEVGCGNGFYTQLLMQQGVSRYMGVDITDALFPTLAKRFPDFKFIRQDVTSDLLDGKFDLIVMIDVIEHIVSEDKLDFAMGNVQRCLAESGSFFVAPVVEKARHSLFHLRFWTAADIARRLSECVVGATHPRPNSGLVIARKQPAPITRIEVK